MARAWGTGPVSLVTALLVVAWIAACGGTRGDPVITAVRPATVAPGGFLLLEGHGFRPGDAVLLDGTPAVVTWVNAETLTAIVPPGLTDGVHQIDVRAPEGRGAIASVRIASPGAPAEAAAAPLPTASPTVTPPLPTAPSPPVTQSSVAPHGDTPSQQKEDKNGGREHDDKPGKPGHTRIEPQSNHSRGRDR
jgi:hypothetical protein